MVISEVETMNKCEDCGCEFEFNIDGCPECGSQNIITLPD